MDEVKDGGPAFPVADDAEVRMSRILTDAMEAMLPKLKAYVALRRGLNDRPDVREQLPGMFDREEVRRVSLFTLYLYDFIEDRGGFDDDADFFGGPVEKALAAIPIYCESQPSRTGAQP